MLVSNRWFIIQFAVGSYLYRKPLGYTIICADQIQNLLQFGQNPYKYIVICRMWHVFSANAVYSHKQNKAIYVIICTFMTAYLLFRVKENKVQCTRVNQLDTLQNNVQVLWLVAVFAQKIMVHSDIIFIYLPLLVFYNNFGRFDFLCSYISGHDQKLTLSHDDMIVVSLLPS